MGVAGRNGLSLVAQAIDGMTESAEEQQITMRSVQNRPYVLDDAIMGRMVSLYTEQLLPLLVRAVVRRFAVVRKG